MSVVDASAGAAERGRAAPQEISGAGKICRVAGRQDACQSGISRRRYTISIIWNPSGAPNFDRDHHLVVYRSVYESVLAGSGDPFGIYAFTYLCRRLPCQDADGVCCQDLVVVPGNIIIVQIDSWILMDPDSPSGHHRTQPVEICSGGARK